jgi:hypothetical protein
VEEGVNKLAQFRGVALVALLVAPLVASADSKDDPKLAELIAAGPDAVLTEADRRHNLFDDQELRIRMTLHGGADEGKVLEFTTLTKGDNRRAIRFHQPADMKGMGVVIKGKDEMYVRLPDSTRTRRVASHARKQSFQGSDFNFDDMGLIRFGSGYDVSAMSDKGDHLELDLKMEAGADLPYPRIVLKVDKATITIPHITYYGDGGKVVKTQERSNMKRWEDGRMTYMLLAMRDATRDHWTQVDVIDEKVDIGIPEDTFSQRWLVRGL